MLSTGFDISSSLLSRPFETHHFGGVQFLAYRYEHSDKKMPATADHSKRIRP